MSNLITKLENPQRIKEIDIVNSLKIANIKETDVVCDYGAGTGIVAIEAGKLTRSKVYAMDMKSEMIDIINSKITENKLDNVETVKVKADEIPLEDHSVDLFVMVTVLHEISEIPKFVQKIKNVLKSEGRVLIIDFYKKDTPMGPPASHRISAYQAARHFFREEINIESQCELGENMYLLVLKA